MTASFGLGSGSPSKISSVVIDESTAWVAAGEGDLPLLQQAMAQLNLPISAADSNGFTFVHAAASYGQIEALRWILSQQGVNVNAPDTDGDTPLHHCDCATAARVLVEEGNADFGIRNNEGKTAREAKEEELAEQEEEEEDSDDEDATNLKELVHYLKGLEGSNDEEMS